MSLAFLALLSWLWLAFLHGRFWESGPELVPASPPSWPAVDVVVPARDEAETIAHAAGSLLAQSYSGPLTVTVVDDGSSDETAAIAKAAGDGRLFVLPGTPPPAGWAGKVWAIAQGAARGSAPYVLFTDADIVHDPPHLAALVAKAEADDLDLVSELVALSCETLPERLLVPAYVWFFQLLYSFARVNDPLSATAAAAGGTMLLHRRALARIGGLAAIKSALIDDVALARAVKRGGRIFLGHSRFAQSLRRYASFADGWRVIARSAFVQLRYSALLLLLMLGAMSLAFLVPPLAVLFGDTNERFMGLAAWALMGWRYAPTLRRFSLSPLYALALPLVAAFYMAASVASAVNYWSGRGVVWKSRRYGAVRT